MDTFGNSIKSDGMTHSSYILLYQRSFLEGVSWSVAQIFSYVMIFYWNFFSKLNHTLKFVLFLPLRRKCCFYYQQLNVPKFRTTSLEFLWGFFSSLMLWSHQKQQIAEVVLPVKEHDVKLLKCCCEGSSAPVHVSALSWPLLKGEEKAL